MTGSSDAGDRQTTPGVAWDFRTQQLTREKLRASLFADADAMRFADVIREWQDNRAFRAFWTAALRTLPFEAYCFEVPPLTRDTLDRPFECVLVESPALARTAPDPAPFAEHFQHNPGCQAVVFENLGRDAVLVAPCPRGDPQSYTHLAAFVHRAPLSQVGELWRVTAEALETRLGDVPVWLSTAGLGVYWLHIRLDSRPKYYRHRPYADADLFRAG
ncbi:MAG: hypothetical protein PVF07_09870 [Thiogranum sp.]